MIEDIIEILKNSSADAWTITDTGKHQWEFYFIRHNLDQNRVVNTEHIMLNVYCYSEDGKYLGNANDEINPTASKEEVQKTIEDLCKRAVLIKNPAYALRQPGSVTKQDYPADLAKQAANFINVMNDLPETKTEDINSYEIFTGSVTKRLITSTGIDVTETYPSSMLEVVSNARNEKEEIELYRMYNSGTCDRSSLKNDITRTLQYGKDRLKAVPTPVMDPLPLVLSTSDALQVYSYFVTRLSADLVYQKLSDYKIGQPAVEDAEGDTITIHAKKYIPNSSRNFEVDEEGAPIRDLTLIDHGIIKNFWGNTMFSSYLGLQDSFILTNYAVDGGEKSEAELRQGKYLEVVEFSDFQVDPITGDMFGEIRLGYLHDGNDTTIVTGGSVSGSMRSFTKDLTFSKETVQYDHTVIPAVTKLMHATVTGVRKESR